MRNWGINMCQVCPGVCALSLGPERCHLALPASSTTGAVLVYDALNLHALCQVGAPPLNSWVPVPHNHLPPRLVQIEAHLSPVSVLAFSRDGHLLASASEKGTVIRVHLVPQVSATLDSCIDKNKHYCLCLCLCVPSAMYKFS